MKLDDEWSAILKDVFFEGLEVVSGRKAVSQALDQCRDFKPTHVLSVGKAAVEMYEGARKHLNDCSSFIITKYGHGFVQGKNVRSYQSAHPIPDENSLRLGGELVAWIQATTSDDMLLVLLSGGASSLAEQLRSGFTLNDLTQMTAMALSDGSTIEELNARRSDISEIKSGGLISRFKGKKVFVLAISDVPTDEINLIGSGIADHGAFSGIYNSKIIASNQLLRLALANACESRGLTVVYNVENLYTSVEEAVENCLGLVEQGGPGIYIFGGEPTVLLPAQPGVGGRAQAMALQFSKAIQGRADMHILVAGSDGTDGISDATGAVVNGRTFAQLENADDYLARADSGTFFKKTGEAIISGPTGTNVADVVILLKQ